MTDAAVEAWRQAPQFADTTWPATVGAAAGPDYSIQIVEHGSVRDAALSADGTRAVVLVDQDVISVWRLLYPHLFKGSAVVLGLLVLVLILRGWRPGRVKKLRGKWLIARLVTVLLLSLVVGILAAAPTPKSWATRFDWYSATVYHWLHPHWRNLRWLGYDYHSQLWIRRNRLWMIDLQNGRCIRDYPLPSNVNFKALHYPGVGEVGLSTDQRQIVVAGHVQGGRRLLVFDAQDGALLIHHHEPMGAMVAMTGDGGVQVLDQIVDATRLTCLSMEDLSLLHEVAMPESGQDSPLQPLVQRAGWLFPDAVAWNPAAHHLRLLHAQPLVTTEQSQRWFVTDIDTTDKHITRQLELSGNRYGLYHGKLSPDGRYACIQLGRDVILQQQMIWVGNSAQVTEFWDVQQVRKLLRLEPAGQQIQPLIQLVGDQAFIAEHVSGRAVVGGRPPSTANLRRLAFSNGQWTPPRQVPMSWPVQMGGSSMIPPPDAAFACHTADGRRSVIFYGNEAYVIDW